MNDDLLQSFFSKSFEDRINEALLSYNYSFPLEKVLAYVHGLLSAEIVEYLSWIKEAKGALVVSPLDMPQFSSFADATTRIAQVFLEHGDKGFSHYEAGKMLQDDGVQRSVNADTKYGENHAKTATYFGYLYSLKRVYYVSCLGRVTGSLSEDEQIALFYRLLIRTSLFKAVYCIGSEGTVELRKMFDGFSSSTYTRRISNVRKLFDMLSRCGEYDFGPLLSRVVY
jgi:hypothetical protein